MDVFADRSILREATELPSRNSRRGSRGDTGFIKRPKPNFSGREVRNKVNKHFNPEPKEAPKLAVKDDISEGAKKAAKTMESAKKADPKVNGKEKVAEGDGPGVFNNDPSNGMTQEKLKSVLNMNAFNFSDKERQVLGKILSK